MCFFVTQEPITTCIVLSLPTDYGTLEDNNNNNKSTTNNSRCYSFTLCAPSTKISV